MMRHWPLMVALTITTSTAAALVASVLDVAAIEPPEAVFLTGMALFGSINLITTHLRTTHAHHQ